LGYRGWFLILIVKVAIDFPHASMVFCYIGVLLGRENHIKNDFNGVNLSRNGY